MFSMTHRLILGLVLAINLAVAGAGQGKPSSYDTARWDPRHFKPLIDQTVDAECLQCHAEVVTPSVRQRSPAGVRADKALAWYQTLDTYSGEQDTFHRRHLVSDFAKRTMRLRCNTCHQGHDPRDETPGSSATAQTGGYTLRKLVDTKVCLMCHGQFNWEVMGLPGPWYEHAETFGNNCLTCHATIRTNRHNVNFLKPQGIESAGQESGDACYGCHGGRAWYRIAYPYPRNAWEGMDKEVPDWARNRPTQSDPRFLREVKRDEPAPTLATPVQAEQKAAVRSAPPVAKLTKKKAVGCGLGTTTTRLSWAARLNRTMQPN